MQCSRAASGRVGHRRFLCENRIIPGEDFTPQKARILLMLALCRRGDPEDISRIFSAH